MKDYEVVVHRPDRPRERFPLPKAGIRLGRAADNTIVLNDPLVSRQHARIWVAGGAPHIEDLGSSNGIEVNGKKVQEAPLGEEDRVTIGKTVIHVVEKVESAFGQTVINQQLAADMQKDILEEASGERFPVLYRAAQLLGTVFDVDDLLEQILSLIFEALPIRRGYILTQPAPEREPEIHASKSLEDEAEGPPLSHTLIEHVFVHREAMLTLDAQEDSRFDQAASIVGHEIHAAMCAPLCGREAVVGAIYVDSGTENRRFGKQDLGLLTAIAGVVGVAVENAHLYQENMRQERLAAIGQATAGVGHCVKNILTGIRGGGEFISMGLDQERLSLIQKGWPIMKSSIDRIEMLVMNMLTFSKEREPQLGPTDLNSIVADILGLLAKRAEKAGVTLSQESRLESLIIADGQQLYRALLNLVVNAIEACASQKGGEVRVFLESDAEACIIQVADTGPGIPEEILPKLSQAFVSSKGSSGTGLGLACTYKIVEEHGGNIEVHTAPDSGASFRIYLPQEARRQRPTMTIS